LRTVSLIESRTAEVDRSCGDPRSAELGRAIAAMADTPEDLACPTPSPSACRRQRGSTLFAEDDVVAAEDAAAFLGAVREAFLLKSTELQANEAALYDLLVTLCAQDPASRAVG
jgi:hypothetical protein